MDFQPVTSLAFRVPLSALMLSVEFSLAFRLPETVILPLTFSVPAVLDDCVLIELNWTEPIVPVPEMVLLALLRWISTPLMVLLFNAISNWDALTTPLALLFFIFSTLPLTLFNLLFVMVVLPFAVTSPVILALLIVAWLFTNTLPPMFVLSMFKVLLLTSTSPFTSPPVKDTLDEASE